jgi:2-methylcitrate dehydratase PrpD
MVQQATQLVSHQQAETRSALERIAAFAAAARAQQLKPNVRLLFKRNILDSLGCAIAALPGRPFQALREQFDEYRAPGRCTLIGGGKTSVDQAALFNSSLTRYVDLLDSYMSPGGLYVSQCDYQIPFLIALGATAGSRCSRDQALATHLSAQISTKALRCISVYCSHSIRPQRNRIRRR